MKPIEWTPVTCRMDRPHAELVWHAAERRNESITVYVRRIVIETAARELGLPVPDMSIYSSESDLVVQAARQLGITPRQFNALAGAEKAAQLLARPTEPPPEPRRPPSGEMRKPNVRRPRRDGSK